LIAQLPPIPLLKYGLSRIPIGPSTNPQLHRSVVRQADARRIIVLDHNKPVSTALVVVALAGDELALGLAILLLELALLSTNPSEA
jgi:hypothetical protein